MVFMCLALSVFSTINEYEVTAGIILFYMETVVVVWFAIEFVLRLVTLLIYIYSDIVCINFSRRVQIMQSDNESPLRKLDLFLLALFRRKEFFFTSAYTYIIIICHAKRYFYIGSNVNVVKNIQLCMCISNAVQ